MASALYTQVRNSSYPWANTLPAILDGFGEMMHATYKTPPYVQYEQKQR